MMNFNPFAFQYRRIAGHALVIVLTFYCGTAQAAVGYFDGMYVLFDVNGGGNTFYQVVSPDTVSGNQVLNAAQGHNLSSDTVNPILDSLGTFRPTAGDSLVLNGFEFKSFNDGGDLVTDAILSYRVTRQGDAPGAFTDIVTNTPVAEVGNDRTWQVTAAGNDILSSLLPGDYTFEFFHRSTATFTGGGGGSFPMGNWNNPDILPAATFSVIPEPASIAMMSISFIGILAWMRRRFDRTAGRN